MRVPTLYIDTSVVGGYFDDEWKDATQELWRQMELGLWRFHTSNLVLDELTSAPAQVRALFHRTFAAGSLLPLNAETDLLADQYVSQAVLTPKYFNDARHVAACTVAKLDYLVSWNFRHMVNVQREAGFNAVNLLQGYQIISIVDPLQLIYGNENKDV